MCSTTCLHLCDRESGTGTRAGGRPYKRNQLPVADDVNSPSQRTGERCSEERWQNERRQRKRSRSRRGGKRDRAVLVAGLLPLLALIRLIWKKKEKNPPPGGILGHAGPGWTFSCSAKTPWAWLLQRDRVSSHSSVWALLAGFPCCDFGFLPFLTSKACFSGTYAFTRPLEGTWKQDLFWCPFTGLHWQWLGVLMWRRVKRNELPSQTNSDI